MASIPKIIKLDERRIKIIERSRAEDALLADDTTAYFLYRSDSVVIDKDLPLHMQREALIHELLHAVIAGKKPQVDEEIDTDELEHWFIGAVEGPIVSILRNNPALIAFLLER